MFIINLRLHHKVSWLTFSHCCLALDVLSRETNSCNNEFSFIILTNLIRLKTMLMSTMCEGNYHFEHFIKLSVPIIKHKKVLNQAKVPSVMEYNSCNKSVSRTMPSKLDAGNQSKNSVF